MAISGLITLIIYLVVAGLIYFVMYHKTCFHVFRSIIELIWERAIA